MLLKRLILIVTHSYLLSVSFQRNNQIEFILNFERLSIEVEFKANDLNTRQLMNDVIPPNRHTVSKYKIISLLFCFNKQLIFMSNVTSQIHVKHIVNYTVPSITNSSINKSHITEINLEGLFEIVF